jgi:E3 ubiquitin-protein ligase RNF115/126
MGAHHDHVHEHGPRPAGGMPPGLQSLFAALLNPANMRSGDAVYSQEALDQIISNLMEQHPQSNAPGPASPDAIASLPKKKVDEKMLGDDGKGECSVCMDDVQLGDEVVSLPCSHWFHETCVGLWLSEHNTCPICRKGIDSATTPASNTQGATSTSSSNQNSLSPWRDNRGPERPDRLSRSNTTGSRNEARLASIRHFGRLTPTHEDEPAAQAPRRWQVVGDRNSYSTTTERQSDQSSPRRLRSSRQNSDQSAPPPRIRSSRQNSESSGRSYTSDLSSRRRSTTATSQAESGGGSGPFAWLRSRWGDRGSRDGR